MMKMEMIKPARYLKSNFIILIVAMAFLPACDGDEESSTEEENDFVVTIDGETTLSEAGNSATFEVKLNEVNNTGAPIQVAYNVNGTATEGGDYEALPGTISIANGAASSTVNVVVINDDEVEGDETIVLTLSTDNLPTNLSIGATSRITITIEDDDEMVEVEEDCPNDNSISSETIGCETAMPDVANTYSAEVSGGTRTITTNGIPDHAFTNKNPTADELNSETKIYEVSATPSKSNNVTSVVNNGVPSWVFGVANNGVKFDPAPSTPFIFEDSDGEYNFDWVFEPSTNATEVGLDCSGAHVQPDGSYHYHIDPVEYANTLVSGLGDGTYTPISVEEVHIGWAADGFPILYKYGNDGAGTFRKLTSSYQLRAGNRPGDGNSAPCGEYNGKYTNDFEYASGLGDLDECNGIDQSITIDGETFAYFYVITDDFPVVPRCFSGEANETFKLGGGGDNGGEMMPPR